MSAEARRGIVMPGNEATDFATAIRAAATPLETCVIEGMVQLEGRSAVPLVSLDPDDAVRLITLARPRALYLAEVAFDHDEAMEDAGETLAEFGLATPPPTLLSASRSVAGHDGEICTSIAGFMVDGVLHTVVVSAGWHEAFEEAVETVTASAREEADTRGHHESTMASAEVTSKAALLAAHPSFNFGRVSFEKRLTLATALFDGTDDQELHEVTRRAENLFWLEQSGFRAGG